MKRTIMLTALALVASAVLVTVATAGGDRGRDRGNQGNKATRNAAVTVFPLRLVPKQEVPPVANLRAVAKGNVTLDVTRDAAGAITSGKVVFYFNYDFPGAVTIAGLHIHTGAKGINGPILVDSGLVVPVTDADGDGNVTTVVTGVAPATLKAILDKPRDYYVNLHTSVNPGGALRDQLRGSNQQNNDKDDG